MKKQTDTTYKIKDIAYTGMMIAVLEAVKQALASVPNVELVSFFIVIFTIYYGWKVVPAVYAFVFIEFFVWGFGIWSISYLYVWMVLVIITMLFHKKNNVFLFSAISGAFGISFGGLCAVTNLFMTGLHAAFGWWLAGIPFDIVHGISNFALCLTLYVPIRKLFDKLMTQNN